MRSGRSRLPQLGPWLPRDWYTVLWTLSEELFLRLEGPFEGVVFIDESHERDPFSNEELQSRLVPKCLHRHNTFQRLQKTLQLRDVFDRDSRNSFLKNGCS